MADCKGGHPLDFKTSVVMPRYVVPPNAGPYRVVTARAGNPLVCNDYTGQRKVLIPCRSKEQADDLCERLNAGQCGEVFV